MTTATAGEAGPSTDATIRRTVRALRGARETDALVLAQSLGISRQSLYNRLNGASPFLAAEVAALATFFEVPILDFYNGVVRVNRDVLTGTETRR